MKIESLRIILMLAALEITIGSCTRQSELEGSWVGCNVRRPLIDWTLRVRAKINSQIYGVEAPGWQGVKEQEYQAYSEHSQRRQAGCIGT